MIPIIANKLHEIEKLCNKFIVNRLFLFGSATNNKFTDESDIDFLFSFGDIPINDYADYFFDFKEELEKLLNRTVDLLTEKSLTNPYLINSINKNKILIYERSN